MNRFRGTAGLSPIRQAEGYWMALREGCGVPKRSQIDPRGLENILKYAFILERIAPGVARFRLAGQHLVGLAGLEVRGMPLTSFFTPSGRQRVAAALEHMFSAPATVELSLASEVRKGRAPVHAHMILLPLENDLGEVNRALGVLVAAEDNASGAPCRFDVTGLNLRNIDDVRAAVSESNAIPAAGFAEAQRGFAQAKSTMQDSRVPYLRLVKGGD